MSDLILHHYDEAPFAEKIRLIFGIKGLSWQSVIIPAAMPKPDLIPLTGGYRRTPVLQIGADLFCDTQLIASELERRYPTPTIFPDGNPGLAYALGSWAHGPYVVSAVAIYMGSDDPFAGNIPLPRHFYEDRKKMWRSQFDTDTLKPKLHWYRAQLLAHTDFINMQLADGRPFLTGTRPGLVDLHAMWDPWFLRCFAPTEAKRMYEGFPKIAEWEKRLTAIGQGKRTELDPKQALEIARAARPTTPTGILPADPLGFAENTSVNVTPTDYAQVPVTGELVATTTQSVSIRRRDPQVGEVVVHFPKIGYSIEAT